MSSFSPINLRRPLTNHQAMTARRAQEAKSNVMETVAKFKKLDGKHGVDFSETRDSVSVMSFSEATLPRNGLGKLGFGSPTKAFGHLEATDKAPHRAEITTVKDGQEDKFSYQKLPNGVEVYQGPTSDGYATVTENSATGTLFVELSEGPQTSLFREAKQTIF